MLTINIVYIVCNCSIKIRCYCVRALNRREQEMQVTADARPSILARVIYFPPMYTVQFRMHPFI